MNQAVGLTQGPDCHLPGPAKRGIAEVITFAPSFLAGCESEKYTAISLFLQDF